MTSSEASYMSTNNSACFCICLISGILTVHSDFSPGRSLLRKTVNVGFSFFSIIFRRMVTLSLKNSPFFIKVNITVIPSPYSGFNSIGKILISLLKLIHLLSKMVFPFITSYNKEIFSADEPKITSAVLPTSQVISVSGNQVMVLMGGRLSLFP